MHAYCLMAHNHWTQLQRLIDIIDDERNDIYLHIDAKCIDAFHRSASIKTRFSVLYIIENPVNVAWGDISLCDAEVRLFTKVVESNVDYQYVHLLSGSDLPTMNQDKIHEFFDCRDDEFIDVRYNPEFKKRIKYYHFFVRDCRDNVIKNMLRRLLLLPQMIFVDRLKHAPLKYAYGSEWCSLTMRAVRELVSKYGHYRQMFEKSTCSDELYKQMILIAAKRPFRIAKEGSLRYVRFDNQNASPKVISMRDFNEIFQSGCIFARKFEENTEVYERVCRLLSS